MWALYRKEIYSFLSSIIGVVVIGIFLAITSIFLWYADFGTNILNGGYANLDGLFALAPWVFLILIPAITMRSFAEEKNNGTFELLFTKPISDLSIIMAKFWACFTLFALAIIPTLIYFLSVYQLGSTKGNLDTGSVWGSYIGLTLLGGSFISIGVFSSSISSNQIVSLILSIVICFVMYLGFEVVGEQSFFGEAGLFVQNLGIGVHYNSISKGRIDTRDVIYFLSLISFFIILTKTVINSRKW
jgi:ABC-2 type transport system permease protein